MAKLSVSVLILISIVTLQRSVAALQCYHCFEADCERPIDQWRKTTCGRPLDPTMESVCLKKIYTEYNTDRKVTVRKCDLQKKGEEPYCFNHYRDQVNVCKSCTTDLCNSSASISLNFVTVAGVFVAMLVRKFLA